MPWDAVSGARVNHDLDTDLYRVTHDSDGENLVALTTAGKLVAVDGDTLQTTSAPVDLGPSNFDWWPMAMSEDRTGIILAKEGNTDALVVDLRSGSWTKTSFPAAP